LLLLEGLQARPQRISSWTEPVADVRARFPPPLIRSRGEREWSGKRYNQR
jgi:hypothetical protein